MWALVITLVSYFLITVIAKSPSDSARRKLVSLIGQVREADGRRYATRDHRGNTMTCIKIIKRTGSEEFIGVYNIYGSIVPTVNLAVSTDLLQWTWIRELAVHASHPTIAVPVDQSEGYILAWEDTPWIHLKFAFYMTLDDLKAGTAQKTHGVSRTLSRCAEGTPNIYDNPTLDSIDVGFHFSDDCTLDRQARATLKNFSSWTQVEKQPNIDKALMHYNLRGSIRARDALSDFDGYEFTIIEGQFNPTSKNAWRIFVFDPQTNTADQVPIITDGGSQVFTYPTMTLTTLNGQRILLVTLFIVSEKSGPGEAGELIYYRIF